MKRLLIFGTSNSEHSINQAFARWTAAQLQNIKLVEVLLNDYEMPLFGVDRQSEFGIPDAAYHLKEIITSADGIIISMAEHNGSYTAAFKNTIDWATRIEKSIWQNKPMFLLGTAPGPRGAKGVLSLAVASFPHWGANIVATFSLPSFGTNFHAVSGITAPLLIADFTSQLNLFSAAIDSTQLDEKTP